MPNSFHRDLLWLGSIPGVGHQRLRSLVEKFGTPEAVMQASFAQILATDGIDRTTAENICNKSLHDGELVEDQLRRVETCQARIVSFWDDDYPERLRQIHDAPCYLFVRGEFTAMDERSVAIVGTRKCTPYGKLMAEKLASDLARLGVTVVSGLARGIDTAAHEAALKAGGRTLAILGSGVDHIYPSENVRLASAVEANGAIISDYMMGTGPDAVNFPNRNRIISGLSLGVVIVEAPHKSGAMITARFALDQNREVFAVPGQAGFPGSEGPHSLIKNGAKLVESVDDIIEELAALGNTATRRPAAAVQLNLDEQAVYNCLTGSPTHVDQVSESAKMPVTETLSVLLALEMQGAVRQVSGKHFIRI